MPKETLKDARFAKAADVMTKGVAYVDGSATAADAIKLMRERRVSSLVVNRRAQEDAWGILTRKDVVTKIVDPGQDPQGRQSV